MTVDSTLVRETQFRVVTFRDGYSIDATDKLVARSVALLEFFEKAQAKDVLPRLENAPETADSLRASLAEIPVVKSFQPAYDMQEVDEFLADVMNSIDVKFASARRAIEEAEAEAEEARLAAALEQRLQREAAEAAALAAQGVVESPTLGERPSGVARVPSADSPDYSMSPESAESPDDPRESEESAVSYPEEVLGAEDDEEVVMDHLDFGEKAPVFGTDESVAELLQQDNSEDDEDDTYAFFKDSVIDGGIFSSEVDDPEALEMLREKRVEQQKNLLAAALKELSEDDREEVLNSLGVTAYPLETGTASYEDESDHEAPLEGSETEPVVEVDTAHNAVSLVEAVASLQYLATHRARDGAFPVVVRTSYGDLGVLRASTDVSSGRVVIQVDEP